MYRNLFIKEFVNFALSDKEEGRSVPEAKRPGRSSDPDNYKELELDYKVETPFGELKVYFIQNDRKGQMAVREIMNAQKGKDWKGPWCLLRGDGIGGIDKDALYYWEGPKYIQTPKRVAFLDGKIIAFCASDVKNTTKWWDIGDRGEWGRLTEVESPWESKVPLMVERKSIVEKVGDFLKIFGGAVVGEQFALEDSGIDDINDMEIECIEEKIYLYDEKGGDIVVYTRPIAQEGETELIFKKGNIEFGVFLFDDDDYGGRYYIEWMRKDNGDGTRTETVYDRYGRRISHVVVRSIEKHGKHPTNELN